MIESPALARGFLTRPQNGKNEMIEINNKPAFSRSYIGGRFVDDRPTLWGFGWDAGEPKWICTRCNRSIPDEEEYIIDGTRHIYRAIDMVRHAEIVERVSTCWLCIIIACAAFVGGMMVFTFEEAPLFPPTSFGDVVIDIFRVAAGLLVFGFASVILGLIAAHFLITIVRRRAEREMRLRDEAEQRIKQNQSVS
jgi:hypothetical protein